MNSISLSLKDGTSVTWNPSKVKQEIKANIAIKSLVKGLPSNMREWSGPQGKLYILHFKKKTRYHKIGIERIKFEFNQLTDFEQLTLALQHSGRMFAAEIKDSAFKIER